MPAMLQQQQTAANHRLQCTAARAACDLATEGCAGIQRHMLLRAAACRAQPCWAVYNMQQAAAMHHAIKHAAVACVDHDAPQAVIMV